MAYAWKEPVAVWAGKFGSIRYTIGDAVLAGRILAKEWPRRVEKTPKYYHACRICYDCIDGKCDAEAARAAFVAAADEAGILA